MLLLRVAARERDAEGERVISASAARARSSDMLLMLSSAMSDIFEAIGR